MIKRISYLAFSFLLVFLIVGCENPFEDSKHKGARIIREMDNKTMQQAEEIVRKNPNADIFVVVGLGIFIKEESIEVTEIDLGRKVVTIEKKYLPGEVFEIQATATRLPKGTMIYSTPEWQDGSILIAELGNTRIRYIRLSLN